MLAPLVHYPKTGFNYWRLLDGFATGTTDTVYWVEGSQGTPTQISTPGDGIFGTGLNPYLYVSLNSNSEWRVMWADTIPVNSTTAGDRVIGAFTDTNQLTAPFLTWDAAFSIIPPETVSPQGDRNGVDRQYLGNGRMIYIFNALRSQGGGVTFRYQWSEYWVDGVFQSRSAIDVRDNSAPPPTPLFPSLYVFPPLTRGDIQITYPNDTHAGIIITPDGTRALCVESDGTNATYYQLDAAGIRSNELTGVPNDFAPTLDRLNYVDGRYQSSQTRFNTRIQIRSYDETLLESTEIESTDEDYPFPPEIQNADDVSLDGNTAILYR